MITFEGIEAEFEKQNWGPGTNYISRVGGDNFKIIDELKIPKEVFNRIYQINITDDDWRHFREAESFPEADTEEKMDNIIKLMHAWAILKQLQKEPHDLPPIEGERDPEGGAIIDSYEVIDALRIDDTIRWPDFGDQWNGEVKRDYVSFPAKISNKALHREIGITHDVIAKYMNRQQGDWPVSGNWIDLVRMVKATWQYCIIYNIVKAT